MRPPVLLEEEQDRQHDGDDDAFEDPEEDDAGAGDEGEHHRGATELPHSGEQGEVGEGECRGDDHRGQRGVRQVGEESVEEHEQQHHDTGADDAGELALGPRLLGDGRTGAAGRDGEPPEEAGGDVGRADADHLLVRLHLLASAGVERGGQGDGVGQRHERDAHRGDEQRHDVTDVGPRHGGRGQPLGKGADRGDVEVEHGGDDGGADHRDEDGRDRCG